MADEVRKSFLKGINYNPYERGDEVGSKLATFQNLQVRQCFMLLNHPFQKHGITSYAN
jgi:hypothetical protein